MRCAITQSAQVAQIAQIDIMLGSRPPLPSGTCREPEDRNGVDQESVIYFLVDKAFNPLVSFIYNSIKILGLILILRFPSVVSSSLFCGFGDHPHCGDLSLGYRRYLISAFLPQASAEAALATQTAQAVLATQTVQAAQSDSCHSTRLCVNSGRLPSMNALVS